MGDVGETLQVYEEIKREERAKKEPSRFKFATDQLDKRLGNVRYIAHYDSLEVYIGKNRIDFWPYTGWYCGRKPIGNVKGRGVSGLIKAIDYLISIQ